MNALIKPTAKEMITFAIFEKRRRNREAARKAETAKCARAAAQDIVSFIRSTEISIDDLQEGEIVDLIDEVGKKFNRKSLMFMRISLAAFGFLAAGCLGITLVHWVVYGFGNALCMAAGLSAIVGIPMLYIGVWLDDKWIKKNYQVHRFCFVNNLQNDVKTEALRLITQNPKRRKENEDDRGCWYD